MKTSRISGFYRPPIAERLGAVVEQAGLNGEDISQVADAFPSDSSFMRLGLYSLG